MGNWRGIEMVGTCPADEVEALAAYCTVDHRAMWAAEDAEFERIMAMPREERDFSGLGEEVTCLQYDVRGSLFGFQRWPAESIHAAGNVGKDVGIDEIADALLRCAEVAPGLSVRVHVGEEWERDGVVATLVLERGTVAELPPEVGRIGSVDVAEAGARLAGML